MFNFILSDISDFWRLACVLAKVMTSQCFVSVFYVGRRWKSDRKVRNPGDFRVCLVKEPYKKFVLKRLKLLSVLFLLLLHELLMKLYPKILAFLLPKICYGQRGFECFKGFYSVRLPLKVAIVL